MWQAFFNFAVDKIKRYSMHSHLNIKVSGDELVIAPDESVDLNLQNPLFNQVEAFSLPIPVPVEPNRKLLRNVEVPQSDMRLLELDKKPMVLMGDGLPIVAGNLMTGADEEINDKISVNLESNGDSFKNRIADLRCCDIPVGDVLIGEKIGQVHVGGSMWVDKQERWWDTEQEWQGGHYEWSTIETKEITLDLALDLPALGFSYPAKCVEDERRIAEKDTERHYADVDETLIIPKIETSYINTTQPFDNAHPYCNARVCYKHYGLKTEEVDGQTQYETDSNVTKDRTNSNEAMWPYWVLDANRPQSGICFYVMYFLRQLFKYLDIAYDDSELYAVEDMRHLCFFTTRCAYGVSTLAEGFFSGSAAQVMQHINEWSESRGCGGKLDMKLSYGKIVREDDGEYYRYIESDTHEHSFTLTADLQQMWATSDCLPEESVQSVIESLENSFGIRFLFDNDNRSCRAVFIRDVFRSTTDPRPLQGEVLSIRKKSEKITGVKVCYSQESSSRDQQDNVRKGVRKYDTDYDYIDYPPESQGTIRRQATITNLHYSEFFKNLSSSDMNVYIDRTTGNAYRIKIDEDAKTVDEWNPVLFEVGGLKGVEVGDCSPNNDDMVELTSQFVPVVMSDVNYQQEVNNQTKSPFYAVYVDEDMEHEFIEQHVLSVAQFDYGSLSLTANLKLLESYDATNTDDGNSPLQHIDWGLSIAMMRGGGADARVLDYDPNYDGFGNYRWQLMNDGAYQMFGDTMDHFGQKFDYNGEASGDGGGERFALKMRAWKQPSWAANPIFDGSTADKNRGLVDTFMAEYIHFLLYRKKYVIRALCSVAELADMANHWTDRFTIGGHTGYINKLHYAISAAKGVGEVEIEFYSI